MYLFLVDAGTDGDQIEHAGGPGDDAGIESTGSAETEDWTAASFTDGEVAVGYAGGCLWAGDPDMDGELEALVLDASVTFTTGFTGARAL